MLENKINILGGLTEKSTTKFSIEISGSERKLVLEANCTNIEYQENNYDDKQTSDGTTDNLIKEAL